MSRQSCKKFHGDDLPPEEEKPWEHVDFVVLNELKCLMVRVDSHLTCGVSPEQLFAVSFITSTMAISMIRIVHCILPSKLISGLEFCLQGISPTPS